MRSTVSGNFFLYPRHTYLIEQFELDQRLFVFLPFHPAAADWLPAGPRTPLDHHRQLEKQLGLERQYVQNKLGELTPRSLLISGSFPSLYPK